MTTPADARAVEDAFEAALAGHSVPAGAQSLAAFTHAVRADAITPGRPNAALAELLATGLLADASRRTAGQPERTSRKRPHMIVTALAAKFVAAGALAKASVAGGAVAIALTGAVTTDVLPLPGEDPTVAESGDTSDAPDATDGVVAEPDTEGDGSSSDDEAGVPGEDSGDGATGGEPVDDVVEPVEPLSYADWLGGPVEGQPFGQWVSAGNHEGWTSGALVSCFAQARSGKPDKPTVEECRALAAAPAEEPVAEEPIEEPVEVPTDGTDPVEDAAVEPAPAPAEAPGNGNAPSAGAGNGNGNGPSAGNGSGGGNGNGGRR